MDSMGDLLVDVQLWPWYGTRHRRQTALQGTGQDDQDIRTSFGKHLGIKLKNFKASHKMIQHGYMSGYLNIGRPNTG